MNEQLDEESVPQILIPKALKNQSADAFARNLVSVSLPLITALVCKIPQLSSPIGSKEIPKDERNQNLKDNPKLDQLKQLKSWYWEELAEVLGERDSKTRSMISHSILDVLSLSDSFLDCEHLNKFALQLCFACEAGHTGRMAKTKIFTERTHEFSEFLLSITPFYISELHDPTLVFSEAFPVILVMKNSDLRRIQLFRNICSSSLNCMRMNCIKAEFIVLEFEIKEDYSWLVCDVFKTFFGNLERDVVLQLMRTGKPVPQTFPNLKEVWIRSDHLMKSLASFVECLLHSYCKLDIKITCVTAVPCDYRPPRCPLVSSTFKVVGIDATLRIMLLFFSSEIAEELDIFQAHFANVETCMRTYNAFVSNTSHIQINLNTLTLSNLRFIYIEDMRLEISPRLPLLANELCVLYIFGPIPDERSDKSLAESLNKCSCLRVLSLSVKLMISPVLEGLNPLMYLKVLCISFTAIADYRQLEPTASDKGAENFLELLLLAAPNLEVLHAPCFDVLPMLIDRGFLKKIHTLSIIFGRIENIKRCILNLPSLKILLLDKLISFHGFLELKRCFSHSSLNISYKKGRMVLPFII